MNNLSRVSSPLGLIWLLVKPSYIGIRMACINYSVCNARRCCSVDNLQLSRQKSACCQRHRERADRVTSRLNRHPVCIRSPGVSSSVQHMFKMAETGNEVRWPGVLGKLGSEGNIVISACRKEALLCPPFCTTLFLFLQNFIVALKAKCCETPNE